MQWLFGLLVVGAAPLSAQQTGVISGRVTDAASAAPVPSAQVQVVGTNLGALTDAQGRYTIRAVPARAVTVRVLRVGYQEQSRPATVGAGATLTVDIALRQASVSLTPVVTTATGEIRRVEIGNAVATIDAAKVAETAPISSLSDMLNSRAPGVSVQSGTQAGTGARVRIRGNNSLSLNNDPIYVIDGVRMTSNQGSISFGTNGNNPSRVQDLNPDEVENIEIVKGPSAATLYGTDAANGVIVITTKKGRAGAPRWTVYGEGGLIKDLNNYTTNYTIAGHSPGSTAYRECALPLISAGTCIMDSVRVYSPLHDPDATPLGTGHRSQVGGQVSGGSEMVRYFISAEREDETGLLELPDFERRRIDSIGATLHEWTERPNVLGKNSVRTNLNAALTPKLDVGLNVGFVNSQARFSLESNATAGLGSHLFGGPGYKNNGTISTSGNIPVPAGTPLNGYRAWTPAFSWAEKRGQEINRLIGAANIQFRPTTWLSTRANIGNDFTARTDENIRYRGDGPPITAIYRDGFKGNARTSLRNLSADLAATASANLTSWANSKTTLGTQYVNYKLDQNSATGTQLSPGGQTAGSGATPNATEATTIQKTLGIFLEEAVAIRERLFLTAAVRTDQNSAFGTNFQRVFYPKASVSWILSDESFFPQIDFMDLFRIRAAYGASGVQPGSNDALRTFATQTPNVRLVDQPGLTYDAVGNTNLRPERTSEFEGGFEARLFNSRATIDLTYYRKRTKDALIDAIVPPSVGAAADVRQNLGAVRNSGWEMLLTGQLIDRRAVAFDITLNGSINDNELVSLGNTPPQIGTSTRAVEGYPLFGFWAQPITGWDDKNKDGILTYNANPALNEVFVGDSAIFRAYSSPRYMATLTPGLDLFNRRFRLQGLFDYRGGNRYYNNTERIRCVSRQNCNGLMNPKASFEEQAMVVATRDHPSKTLDGFYQPGAFVKLREVAATFTASPEFARRFVRGRTFSVTASGRNLALWTNYRGADPETDYTASEAGENTPSDFQTVAPPSYFVIRLNVGF
ncbi:SusC/RagA family TonB-linked outer membrane protein [Roseisolibacter agri]|uniref:SusC/RagA family TonB-linked outer membrane protein n=2 Tax=Roseisolibacter agri TaxID=2014610 RepID=A0AA37V321_9BACT|nr:SusC/RagA family TonB-linked outer membrane protein [Roseisolibacter agri]